MISIAKEKKNDGCQFFSKTFSDIDLELTAKKKQKTKQKQKQKPLNF